MLEPIIAPSTGVSLLMSEAFSKGVVPVSARMRPDPHQLEPLEMMTTPWLLPFLSSPVNTNASPPETFSRRGLLIAHEGGMGKTYAALISALTEIHRFGGTLLIVCPKQVKGTWRREANVFGSIEPRLQSCTQIFQDAKPGIFITSKASLGKIIPANIPKYGQAVKARHGRLVVIVDEAHYGGISKAGATEESQHDFDFENGNAPRPGAVYDRLTKICAAADSVYLTTATPMRNKPTEMFELFKQLIPQEHPLRSRLDEHLEDLIKRCSDPDSFTRKEWYPLLDRIREGRIDSGDEALFRTRLIEEVLLSQQEEDFLSERLEHLDYPSAVAEHGPSLARDAHPLGRFLSAAERSDIGADIAEQRFRTWQSCRIDIAPDYDIPTAFGDAGQKADGTLRDPVGEHWANLLLPYEGTTLADVATRKSDVDFLRALKEKRNVDPRLEALTTLVLEENHLAMEEDWLKRRGVIVFVKYKGTARALAEDINAQLGDVAQAIHTVEDEDTSDGQGDRTSVGERTLRMFSDRCRKNHKSLWSFPQIDWQRALVRHGPVRWFTGTYPNPRTHCPAKLAS